MLFKCRNAVKRELMMVIYTAHSECRSRELIARPLLI